MTDLLGSPLLVGNGSDNYLDYLHTCTNFDTGGGLQIHAEQLTGKLFLVCQGHPYFGQVLMKNTYPRDILSHHLLEL